MHKLVELAGTVRHVALGLILFNHSSYCNPLENVLDDNEDFAVIRASLLRLAEQALVHTPACTLDFTLLTVCNWLRVKILFFSNDQLLLYIVRIFSSHLSFTLNALFLSPMFSQVGIVIIVAVVKNETKVTLRVDVLRLRLPPLLSQILLAEQPFLEDLTAEVTSISFHF